MNSLKTPLKVTPSLLYNSDFVIYKDEQMCAIKLFELLKVNYSHSRIFEGEIVSLKYEDEEKKFTEFNELMKFIHKIPNASSTLFLHESKKN